MNDQQTDKILALQDFWKVDSYEKLEKIMVDKAYATYRAKGNPKLKGNKPTTEQKIELLIPYYWLQTKEQLIKQITNIYYHSCVEIV